MADKPIQNIREINWYKWGSRRMTFRWAEHISLCTLQFHKFFKLKYPDQLILIKNDVGHGFFDKTQLDSIQCKLLKKLYHSSFYNIYEKQGVPILTNFLIYCKKIAKLNLKKLSKKDLLKIYDEFIKKEDDFTVFLWIIFMFDFFTAQALEKNLLVYLKKIKQDDKYDHYLNTILSLEKKTAIITHTIDVLKVVNKVKNKKISKSDINLEIDKLSDKYGYFTILNFDEKPLSKNYLRKEINKILANKKIIPQQEINRINNNLYQTKREYKKLSKVLKGNAKLYKLADACHKITFYRDYRNDLRRESYFYARKLYQEIADRLEIDLTSLLYLTRDEIRQSFIANKLIISPQQVKKRRQFSAITIINNKTHYIFDHKQIRQLFKIIDPKISVKDFKGVVGSPGKIIGRAKIILNIKEEYKKLREGDILITSMTNLDFIPLMSKAAAIITDEGGLLCHAAIVSRELKKPCIVGTTIATKAIKDNDLVEVNANHGLVTIL